jgi:acyl carrier protein
LSIQTKVISIVSTESDIPAANISEFTKLESLGLDSLEFVGLMLAIRSELVDIPEEKWVNLETVGDIVRACERVH